MVVSISQRGYLSTAVNAKPAPTEAAVPEIRYYIV